MLFSKLIRLLFLHIFMIFFIACGGGGNKKVTEQETLDIISRYAVSNGASQSPNVHDYDRIGITGINEKNIKEINDYLTSLSDVSVDTKEEIQNISDNLVVLVVDTDNDGLPNGIDLDDDNDGLIDINDDFVLDAREQIDTDGDGVGNNADRDDDNDGVLDVYDRFPLDIDESSDFDNDGLGDNADRDDDNDGVLDTNDAFIFNANESMDSDGDGIGNNADTDDDNDGITDKVDPFPLHSGDGLDTDGDGTPDATDRDDDNDGIIDTEDAFSLDVNESIDTDGDGVGNNADADDDGDDVNDLLDAFPLDNDESSDFDGDGRGDNADIDDDNDGMPDSEDAFPLDANEQNDTDKDGIGNNADMDDDNDGIEDRNDFYALSKNCSKESDGDGVSCYVDLLKDVNSKNIFVQNNVLLFVDSHHDRIVRYDYDTKEFIQNIEIKKSTDLIGKAVSATAYNSHQNRIYIGYSTGEITYVYLGDAVPVEKHFITLPQAVGGISEVGNYILAQDGSGAWNTHYTFDDRGVLLDSKEWNQYSRYYAWDSVNHKVYFFRDGSSPNDLHFETIDPMTGKIIEEGETPYHGDYAIKGPIFVSADGDSILLGSGDVYNGADLTWKTSLPQEVKEALWTGDNELIYGYSMNQQTIIKRRNHALIEIESLSFEGDLLKILKASDRYIILTDTNKLSFYEYRPSDDSDNDGIMNSDDAFPTDPAASVDKDGDKFADRWNDGYSQADSTTGLKFDYYPDNLDCNLLEHGDGMTCDISTTIPFFIPDDIETDKNGIIYLFSNENRRIYRWDISKKDYIDPLLLEDDMLSTVYSSKHNRLYIGYDTGEITYIELDDNANLKAKSFTTLPLAVGGLSDAGNYILAQDGSGAWNTHYTFDINAVLLDSKEWNYYSRSYAWDSINDKVYFFRDDTSPNDLHFETINQITGKIIEEGETPYHGDYTIKGAIKISVDGDSVLLGVGDIYNADDLTWKASLPHEVTDALWTEDGLMTVRSFNNTTYLQTRDFNFLETDISIFTGLALKLIRHNDKIIVITSDNSKLVFHEF